MSGDGVVAVPAVSPADGASYGIAVDVVGML